MKHITWVMALMVSVLQLNAQHTLRLFGYVTDDKNRPIEFATVKIEGTAIGAFTSQSGFYDLSFDIKDTVTLSITCVGYQSVIKKIATSSQAAQLNVALLSSATELQGVEVTGHRLRTGSMELLNIPDYRLLPDATGGSIESFLSTLPGVHSTNEMSSQYSVRGGNYDENSVYVNGIEVYRPLLIRSGQQEGLSFINPDMVQGVAFSAGGFAPKYGDKMASVLDITYKQVHGVEGAVSLGMIGASAYVGSGNDRFSQLHGIRYKSNSYLLNTLDTKGQYKPTFFDYQTFLTCRFSPQWDVSFLGNISQNSYRFIPENQETSFGTLDMPLQLQAYFGGQEKDLFQTAFGALTLNYHPNKELKMNLIASAYSTNEDETYDIIGQYWLYQLEQTENGGGTPGNTLGVGTHQQHERNSLTATVAAASFQGEYTFNSHQLEWGITAQHQEVNNMLKQWEYRDSAGYSLPYNPDVIELYNNLAGNLHLASNRFSGYIQDVYKYRMDVGLWIFTGGIRFNYWDYNRQWLASPRLTAIFAPRSSNWQLRFATGIYNQIPFFKELRDTMTVNHNTIAYLNTHIKAQRSWHVVLGADYHFMQWGRPFKFTAEAYYKPATDVIPYVVDNIQVTYFGGNCAKAYSAGLDLKLFGEFVPGTDSWIGLSLMQADQTVQKGTDAAGKPVFTGYFSTPTDQRYAVTLFFQDYLPNNPRLKVNLKLIWSDGLPVSPPNNPYLAPFRTPDYRRVDLGASYSFIDKDHRSNSSFLKYFKSLSINLDVFNLLDISNVNSYFWLNDIYNRQFAIPNYLTGRLLNFRISADF